MAEYLEISVDISEATESLKNLNGNLTKAGRKALNRALRTVRAGIPSIIMEQYDIAVASTGGEFPLIYAAHLRQGIQSLRTEVTVEDDDLIITMLDIESLGDSGDLMEASHYRAILDDLANFSISNPPLSQMGEDVDSLYGPNKVSGEEDNREAFFDAMVVGADYTAFVGPMKARRAITISTAGMYEATLQARVEHWGNRYPEWILLDEGSPAGIISSNPTHFVELTREAVEQYAADIVEQLAIIEFEEVDDSPPSAGTPVFDPGVGRFRGPGGRFVKGG